LLYKYAEDFTKEGITMTKIRNKFLTATLLLALGGLHAASAATFTGSIGNTASGLSDGDTPTGGELNSIQVGQAAPFFDQSCGADVLANPGNCSANWSLSVVGAITDPILSASLTLGIVDHDSDAGGSQLGSFSLDTLSDLTALLDTEFETTGGLDGMYNVYTIDLAGFFAYLADGSALISLALQGNGLQTCTLAFACPGKPLPFVSETGFNGANLIFSTLTIETLDSTIPPVPLPAAAPLFKSALFLMGIYRRRVLRDKA
jgi:hypothetical protein